MGKKRETNPSAPVSVPVDLHGLDEDGARRTTIEGALDLGRACASLPSSAPRGL